MEKISKSDQNVLQMILNPNLPVVEDEVTIVDDSDSKFDKETLSVVKNLEKNGVKLAEEKKFGDAMKLFDEAIDTLPLRASGFNNRAQVKRLMGNVDGALDDLNKAIELSKGRGKAGELALVQRGMIKKLKGEKESAFDDFKQAADLGNLFAKKEIVESNPYAALCNQMLGKVIGEMQKGTVSS
uniref:Tetratricopeptide repeat protein 36 n=1 Tax=Ciona savignyi TaxID=51511 RepID=H2Z4S6_CIOSA